MVCRKIILICIYLVAMSNAYADDNNGNFETDILAPGKIYSTVGGVSYNENSNVISNGHPGRYKRNYNLERIFVRYGLLKDIDISASLPYYSKYKNNTSYVNGPSFISNKLEGWGNLNFNISYGIINEKNNPFSIKASLSISPNNSGKTSGAISPNITIGYKFNDAARVYSSADLTYATSENYSDYKTFQVGAQYDFSKKLTIDIMTNYTIYPSFINYKSYSTNRYGVAFIYSVNDYLFIIPAFINSSHSDITSKNNINSNKSTSDIQTYQISLKYIFN